MGCPLPGGGLHWPAHPLALVLLAGPGCALAWLHAPVLLARRWLVLRAALVMIGGFVRPAVQPGWPGPTGQIVACDVGQGDGLVGPVDDAAGGRLRCRAGPRPDRRAVSISSASAAVPLLIFTHFHADHVDGLDGVLAGRQVGEIWLSPYASPPTEAARVMAVARSRHIPTQVPAVGERVTVGRVGLQVFGPVIRPPLLAPLAGEDSSSQQNEESIVTRVSLPGLSMLETGDIEPTQQAAVLESGADLRADVLKIPHHGSANQDPAFIAATGARLAIASAGLHNDYGHPAPKTVRLVQSDGMALLRTDLQGSVAIGLDHGRVVAVAQKS